MKFQITKQIERLEEQLENLNKCINYVNKNDNNLTEEDEEWLKKNIKYRKLIIEDLTNLNKIKLRFKKLNLTYDIFK